MFYIFLIFKLFFSWGSRDTHEYSMILEMCACIFNDSRNVRKVHSTWCFVLCNQIDNGKQYNIFANDIILLFLLFI